MEKQKIDGAAQTQTGGRAVASPKDLKKERGNFTSKFSKIIERIKYKELLKSLKTALSCVI